ncbi:MAG: hypothetical protein QW175_02815 [Candidatus Bathyarchaeia archaeon]
MSEQEAQEEQLREERFNKLEALVKAAYERGIEEAENRELLQADVLERVWAGESLEKATTPEWENLLKLCTVVEIWGKWGIRIKVEWVMDYIKRFTPYTQVNAITQTAVNFTPYPLTNQMTSTLWRDKWGGEKQKIKTLIKVKLLP